MQRIAMIGFALATVSVLLAGCAAGSSQEPLYTTVDTPYYDVMLPTSCFTSFAVDYDDSYRLHRVLRFRVRRGLRRAALVRPVRHVFVRSRPWLSAHGGQRRSFCMARSARVRVAADLPD